VRRRDVSHTIDLAIDIHTKDTGFGPDEAALLES